MLSVSGCWKNSYQMFKSLKCEASGGLIWRGLCVCIVKHRVDDTDPPVRSNLHQLGSAVGWYKRGYQKQLKAEPFQTRADSQGSCLQVCLHLWCRHGLGLCMIRAFNQSGIFLTQFLPSHSGWHPAPNSHCFVWSGLNLPSSHSPGDLPHVSCLWLGDVGRRNPTLDALSCVFTGGHYLGQNRHCPATLVREFVT